jgi:hypothetical protein
MVAMAATSLAPAAGSSHGLVGSTCWPLVLPSLGPCGVWVRRGRQIPGLAAGAPWWRLRAVALAAALWWFAWWGRWRPSSGRICLPVAFGAGVRRGRRFSVLVAADSGAIGVVHALPSVAVARPRRRVACSSGGGFRGRRATWWTASWVWRCVGGVAVVRPAVASLDVCQRRYGGVDGDGQGSAHQRRHGA